MSNNENIANEEQGSAADGCMLSTISRPASRSADTSNSMNMLENDIVSDAQQSLSMTITTSTLSKNQQKKLIKREKWLKIKGEKRACEKQKRKRKFAEAREKGEILGPTRKSLKRRGMKDSKCQVRVVIDCSFDDMMTDKDVVHLTQQIQHSYAANRRAENALQFYVSGINGKLKKRLEGIGDYKGWDIFMKEENYRSLFKKEDIIYLSSESPNILKTIEDDKIYIIGGLVDHNHRKGFCHNVAEEHQLNHAQLPLGEYIDMKARKVLTINHVFEILLHYTESHSWQKAFYTVLPQRKGAIVKSVDNIEDNKDNVVNNKETMEDKVVNNKETMEDKVVNNKETMEDKVVNNKETMEDKSETNLVQPEKERE